MQDAEFLPVIIRQQYELFRKLPQSDLPNTYDEWLNLHTNIKRERGQMGFNIREVQIDPHQFAEYCRSRGIAADGLRLSHFAREKGLGNM